MRAIIGILSVLAVISMSYSQSESAYSDGSTEQKSSSGLLDPSRFSINHSMSFGMSSSSMSGTQSQSMYSTSMQYRFVAPVTLNLNFSLPLHSTFNSAQNLNSQNIQSTEYLKNMPLDFSLTWQPRQNFLMQFSVVRDPGRYDYFNPYGFGTNYSDFRR